jgi:ribosomal protein L37AE/L43A
MQITTKFEVGQEVFLLQYRESTRVACPTCEGKQVIRTRTGRLLRCGHCDAEGLVAVPSEADYVPVPVMVHRIRIDHVAAGAPVEPLYLVAGSGHAHSGAEYGECELHASMLEAEVARAVQLEQRRKEAAEKQGAVAEATVEEAAPYDPAEVTYVTVDLAIDARVPRETAEHYVRDDLTHFMAPRGFVDFKILDVRNAREDD